MAGKERKRELEHKVLLAVEEAAKAVTHLNDQRERQDHRKAPGGCRNQRRSAHRRKQGFSPERQSGYTVTLKGGTLDASRIHGLVVNELARELSRMGFEVTNTGLGESLRPDLALMDLPAVIEVKSRGEWDDIFHGIGQCYVYGYLLGGNTQTGKMLVLPALTDPVKIAVLGRLGINVVKWREKGGEVSFTRLKRALPRRASDSPEIGP